MTETIIAIDVRPSTNELWLLTRDPIGVGRLYIVNTGTAAATLTATLDDDPQDTTAPYSSLSLAVNYGLDFNPLGAVALRIHGSDGSNLRLATPTNGLVTTDGALTIPASPDIVAAAYTNSFLAPPGVTLTTTLFGIDAVTGSLYTQNPPNNGTLNLVGALSAAFTFDASGSFDIAGGNNGLALAILTRTIGNPLAPEAFSRLFRVNLTTGAATEIGTGIGGPPVRGLAIRVR
ncbi:MAG: DUF4394 domain-containing protein [Deltaproteobacteria bacterium]|nr:DUF4394 domain-containing protein [Deltaproteobacteria bacterium]